MPQIVLNVRKSIRHSQTNVTLFFSPLSLRLYQLDHSAAPINIELMKSNCCTHDTAVYPHYISFWALGSQHAELGCVQLGSNCPSTGVSWGSRPCRSYFTLISTTPPFFTYRVAPALFHMTCCLHYFTGRGSQAGPGNTMASGPTELPLSWVPSSSSHR